MLSYLAVCARRGVVVVAYEDDASGTLALDGRGGRFTSAVLRPVVTVVDESQASLARELHGQAHERCFVASSVAFPVTVDPTIRIAPRPPKGAGALA